MTVPDPQAVPLERVLGREVGAVYRDIHLDHGVRMRLGTGVDGFEGAAGRERQRPGGRRPDRTAEAIGTVSAAQRLIHPRPPA
jgi:NADPH-dependent 2,4-dienoyl-CoA reductase/sulfur reductase-like enzyme